GGGHGGTINLTATKSVSLTNGTVLDADNVLSFGPLDPPTFVPQATGGTIHINGGAKFTSEHSALSANSALGNGGTINIEAENVDMTNTQVTTSVSGVSQTVGGHITVDAKTVTLKHTQILSTATEGQGGTIEITSHVLHQKAGSVIDASSQTGTDGIVIIH